MVYRKDSFANFHIFIAMLLCLLSCYKTTDVSENRILSGGYKRNMILLLKKDILIMRDGMLWDHKPDIEIVKRGYQLNRYRGILKAGSKIRIERIELYSHVEDGNYIYPIGKIIDGEWKGEEINLHFASKSSDSPYNDTYYINILDIDPVLFDVVNNEGNEDNVQ